MFRKALHPGISPRRALARLGAAAASAWLATSAFACGVASGEAGIATVAERAEIVLDDGRRVRLAGLDIPLGSYGGFDAATPARARLTQNWAGKRVSVALLAPRADRWGRWLADLALPDGAAASSELIAAGLARVRPEFETRGCEVERLGAEAAARARSLGLWNDPDSVLDAADLEGLRAADGRFVVIEGAVARVGVGRSRVYLDFGQRGGFTAIVERKAEPALQRRGFVFGALAGKTIRVRGVLENRFGPRIEIADPLMIERVEDAGSSKAGG